MKNKLVLVIGIFLSVVLAYIFPAMEQTKSYDTAISYAQDTGSEDTLLVQKKQEILSEPHIVSKIYLKDQLIGVLTNEETLKNTLKEVYKRDYEVNFPNTEVGLGEDVYIVQEQSYIKYQDIDEEIMNYLSNNNLFSILTNKVQFSNGAVIYVKNAEDFVNARERFLLNFISKGAYDALKLNQTPTALTTFGEQELSLEVLEKMTITQGLAPQNKILMTDDDILEFLNYGYGTTKTYYTVKPYDTVEGVARQARTGIDAQQLISINPGVLKSEDQVLSVGQKLNVTYFNSPLTVVVVKERLAEEIVYPEPTKYIYDNTLPAGRRVVVSKEVIGKRNVRYYDTYTNGILTSGEEVSSLTTVQPVQEIIRVGVYNEEDYNEIIGGGSGQFRWPVQNPRITCRWGCYAGHQAIDIQNRYNLYGNCYASDAGVVIKNSYDSIGGYSIQIDHGNGYYTYYGHFRERSAVKVGAHVEKGQMIGKIGATGYATGPHVHFEVWVGGRPYTSGARRINPCSVLGC
ncbi:MAG: M23 family metallopeptidase [Erysipelotrichaceae bacterium]|nr:M23 family metallopeptidase [Erysipelotrichaceae bacterium]